MLAPSDQRHFGRCSDTEDIHVVTKLTQSKILQVLAPGNTIAEKLVCVSYLVVNSEGCRFFFSKRVSQPAFNVGHHRPASESFASGPTDVYWVSFVQHSMSGHHRPASETPFEWRFDDGPMVARLQIFTGYHMFHSIGSQ